MKKVLFLAICFTILTGMVFAQGNDENGGPITIKAGHGLPEETSLGLGFTKFKELIEESSNGEILVEIYSNGQLGGDRELTESLQLGNVTMTAVSATNLATFAKEFFVLDSFFMFDSREHVYKVLDGTAGDKMLNALSSKNIAGLGYWENGFRHLTNSKRSVQTPEDMTGIKMRVPENPVQIAAWKSVNAGPTPMAWGELFTALQQKVLDGQECTMENIEKMKFYEVQPFISLTGHKYSPYVVIMNKEFYDGLSESHRTLVDQALEETSTYQRNAAEELEKEGLEVVRKAGNTITEVSPEAKAEFRNLMSTSQSLVKEKAGEDMFTIFLDEVEKNR
ncbi:MAG: DctP family TRAP transporter solute-binding subunit [Spirochaetia bacterium]|nr:DctP family TRAP transporter solute-binding subunit [Spirochaetia bacterium]MCF7946498.1 DctP family TRAP transporter solute-binding subunit [Spirochaetia bacterium]MCF7952485.1 DctP family TRAP transporter solute-binding subunit [Spirochaetales bacterium]